MGGEQRAKTLRVALASGSLVIIAAGVALGLAGQWFGWLIAALGVFDAAAIPFVLRAIEGRRGGRAASEPSDPEPVARSGPESTAADPSYNPYARED